MQKNANFVINRIAPNPMIFIYELDLYSMKIYLHWYTHLSHPVLTLYYPPLDNIRVMVIVWRLRGNIIRTAPCWAV